MDTPKVGCEGRSWDVSDLGPLSSRVVGALLGSREWCRKSQVQMQTEQLILRSLGLGHGAGRVIGFRCVGDTQISRHQAIVQKWLVQFHITLE